MKSPASTPSPAAAPVEAQVHRQRLSVVWLIPLIAVALGLWLVWQHYAERGPLIEVRFETAEGVEAAKTAVQCRSVSVGRVETVRLAPDLKGVVMTVRIDREASSLLHEDSRFWVVRPRFGGAGITGVGTLVSGTYLELDPGQSPQKSNRFTGLENPPVTPLGVPGLHVTLVAEEVGSIGPGSPVTYRGIKVGKIESQTLNTELRQVEFGAFIQGEFGRLITNRTRFWNISGIDLDVGANGVRLRTGSLASLVAGGVAFDTVDTVPEEIAAAEGAVYKLFRNQGDTEKLRMNPTQPYLLLFEESVRGLNPEAPVEFRGIRVGTVAGISFDYVPDDPQRRVPVLIRIDPSLIVEVPEGQEDRGSELIAASVRRGLRATLRTGSLITGQLFVDLDFIKDAKEAEVVQLAGNEVLPTVITGLGQLQDKLVAVLDKVQALRIEDTVEAATAALAEIQKTAASLQTSVSGLDTLLTSRETQGLPGDVKASLAALQETLEGFNKNSPVYRDLGTTMTELNRTLRSIDSLATTLERQPNSLLFGNPTGKVSPPKGKR